MLGGFLEYNIDPVKSFRFCKSALFPFPSENSLKSKSGP